MEHDKEQAFIDAVHDRREQMYRIALGYLRNPEDAEDAVSDEVAATWKNLKRIQNTDALPAYLIRCTINAARFQLRKRKKTQFTEQFPESLVAGESGDLITDYLSGMKERDQLLLILKYQENLREREIAAILHVPRGTVSSRIFTLLKRIKAELLKEESNND